MALPEGARRMTLAEYFAFEATSETRHEYHEGWIFEANGGTYEHDAITVNLTGELRTLLRGTPCRVSGGNLRIRPGSRAKCVYPDASIVCGDPQFDSEDTERSTVVNPMVIAEVLSPSTEPYDRAGKFELYRTSPTLVEYVLVAQNRPHVETYHRHPDGLWSIRFWTGLGATVSLPSVGVELPMSAIYEGVEFPPPDEDPRGVVFPAS